MDGQGCRPRKPTSSVGFLLLTTLWCGTGWVAEVGAAEEDEPVLVGLVTREEVEAVMPDWVLATVAATPDIALADVMADALSAAEVNVFFGTWCADSGRELPRLWRVLDEAGVLDPAEIRYIGVNREMTEPAAYVTGQDLKFVPTFVVSRGGEEVGRIVESSPNGIESDLLALLRGDKAGLITGREDFEATGDGD